VSAKRFVEDAWEIARVVAEVDKQLLSSRAVEAFAALAETKVREATAELKRERDELLRLAPHQPHCEAMKRADAPDGLCTCWKRAYIAAMQAAKGGRE
jgi:hypothetical protein